jgi:hypothetical protein
MHGGFSIQNSGGLPTLPFSGKMAAMKKSKPSDSSIPRMCFRLFDVMGGIFIRKSMFVALLASTSVVANAEELTNRTFGFRMSIPDSFHEIAIGANEPDTLGKFADRDPNPSDPPTVIQIQRLRGTIGRYQRLKLEDMPKIAGMTSTLEETTWDGLRLDIMRQVMTLPNQTQYVAYGIQFPLSDEAVQLHVGGPVAKDEEVRLLFKTEVTSFKNTKPLVDDSSARSGRMLTNEERIFRLLLGIAQMAITVAVIAFVVITILRSRRKKIPPKIEPR